MLTLMRLRKVSVTGLFGLFNHEIPLHMGERLTIIHGPNGYGKTIILRMVAGLMRGYYAVFQQVPFETFSLEFDDGRQLTIQRFQEPRHRDRHGYESAPPSNLEISIHGASLAPLEPYRVSVQTGDVHSLIAFRMVERHLPFIKRMGPDAFMDARTGGIVSLEEFLETYGHELPPHVLDDLREIRNEPPWLTELRSQLPPVRFIQTQRLVVREAGTEGGAQPAVEAYSQELANRIKQTLANYAARSQELDRTFPERLLNQEQSEQLEVEELRRRLSDLDSKRTQLTELGFLNPEQGPGTPSLQALEQKRDVLSVYVSDVAKKLEIFDELAAKILLLTRIINERFRFKHLKIHRERGFVFTSATNAHLKPADLSSGEQHELILLYELLFMLDKNALVLIDEPELSLHVAWQEHFLPDLLEMIKLSKVDVLLATHSPEIIGNYWDLTVALKGPAEIRKD